MGEVQEGELECVAAGYKMVDYSLSIRGCVLQEGEAEVVRFVLARMYRAGFLLGFTLGKEGGRRCRKEKVVENTTIRAGLLAEELISRLSSKS